ncbi:hypothetical protein [Dyadobacter sp. 676]|uniref:Nucleotidyltransferase family protein n=1 Tax=Dyadobacter sp. 676 TaxID=3088362 RepID=A0AAU8FD18_9BACT
MIIKSAIFGEANAREKAYWRSKTPQERLDAALQLILRARAIYNANPLNPPLNHGKGIFNLIRLLNEENIEYVVLGGHAVIAHGYLRTTGDVDIFVNPTDENAEKLLKVMFRHGYTKERQAAHRICATWKTFSIKSALSRKSIQNRCGRGVVLVRLP